MRVGALQAEEGHLQAQPQQAAWRAEVVVGGGGQQVNVGGIAVQQRLHVAAKAVAGNAEAQTYAGDQVVGGREQVGNLQGGEAGVGGGEGASSWEK